MGVERYRSIIPDWDRFVEAARRPEPTTLRVRAARVAAERLVERLESKGFGLEPVSGLPGFLRVVREPYSVAKTLEHWLGHFYIQQAVTGLAAPALGPRPGERVLDLCAAPGGKTVHLAELLEDRGIVVASDRDEKRLRALLGNVYRMGHPNVLALAADGRAFPGGARFDRVLVDAPCSAEGNLRRRGGELPRHDASFKSYVVSLQTSLLRRAVELVRPGGTVLYVTCTFAPDENEGVVDAALRELPVKVEPIELDVPHAPGLTAFGDRSFDASLAGARRLYPHHLDSGGLFLARLRREGGRRDASPEGWTSTPPVYPDDGTGEDDARRRIEAGREGLERTFGVAGAELDRLRWIVRGKSVWAHGCDRWPLPAWRREEGSGDWRILSLGLRALKRDPRDPSGHRPTNDLVRRLAPHLRDRLVDLERERLLPLLEREPLDAGGLEDGFAALRFGDDVLGRGWVKRGRLHNEIPKAHSRRLLRFLETGAAEPAPTGGGSAGGSG